MCEDINGVGCNDENCIWCGGGDLGDDGFE